jgi:DNA-binding transcriptional MerR regulator
MRQAQSLWTIQELGAQVALALSADYGGPPNGRVREIPDQRTIRYYTTIGLLDRAAEMRGRTALYSHRHLLQLVAIKRLQARGLSLSAIQQQLIGLGDAALRRVAKLPDGVQPAQGAGPASAPSPATPREPFWTAAPASPSGQALDADQREVQGETAQPTNGSLPAVLQGISLDGDVILLFAPIRPVVDDDLQAIRTVAAPLLKLLQTRRLLGQTKPEETS